PGSPRSRRRCRVAASRSSPMRSGARRTPRSRRSCAAPRPRGGRPRARSPRSKRAPRRGSTRGGAAPRAPCPPPAGPARRGRGGPIEAGPELRKARLLFGESAAHLLDAEVLERAFKEMKAVLADPAAKPEERLRATRVLLAIGDRNRASFGREAVERARRELETAGFDAPARRDVAQRAAALLFALGDWSATVALLGREFDAATAPLDVLVPWARASERIVGAEAAALSLHERLLGARGGGGRLAVDAQERPGL